MRTVGLSAHIRGNDKAREGAHVGSQTPHDLDITALHPDLLAALPYRGFQRVPSSFFRTCLPGKDLFLVVIYRGGPLCDTTWWPVLFSKIGITPKRTCAPPDGAWKVCIQTAFV